METAQTIPAPAPPATNWRAADPFREIGALGRGSLSPSEFAKRALEVVAVYFNAPTARICRRLPSGDIEHRYAPDAPRAEAWSGLLDRLLLVAQGEGRAVANIYGDREGHAQITLMASPMINSSGEGSGAIALMVGCTSRSDAERALSELRALCAYIGQSFPTPGSAPGRAEDPANPATTGALARAAAYRTLHEFAFSVTNSLRNRVGCDQVSLAMVRGSGVRLLSISGLDDLKPRSPGTLRVRQAMEECLDRGEAIVCQHSLDWESTVPNDGHRLHQQWHEDTGRAAVLSLPLLDGDRVVGVLSLRRAATSPFTEEDSHRIQEMIKPLGPAMRLVARASRPLAAHARDAATQVGEWLLRPVGLGRKLSIAAAGAALAWFCLGTTDYTIAVPAVVTAASTRTIAAPYEATIDQTYVRPGDTVVAGQVLARLDTRDLKIQRREIEAELEIAGAEVDAAINAGDVAEAGIAQARRRIFQARLDLVQARLDRAVLLAPEDGLILEGDLSERLGEVVPIGEPLFRFAPSSSLTLELEVPETAADDVAAGLTARFASGARPESPSAAEITAVLPAAEVRRGRTVFVAEADLAENAVEPWLRMGMEGVARIECGPRPVWWVSLHKAIDYFHLRVLP